MNSVFSNYLSPYVEAGLLRDAGTPHEIYTELAIAYNQGSIGVQNTTRWFVPYYEEQDPDDFDDILLHYIYSNKYLQELIRWFNSKTIPEFVTMSPTTMNVRIRIFCSKLNALVEKELVEKEKVFLVQI
jgi:hypothetical protein